MKIWVVKRKFYNFNGKRKREGRVVDEEEGREERGSQFCFLMRDVEKYDGCNFFLNLLRNDVFINIKIRL